MPIGPFSAKDHLTISTLGLEFAAAVGIGVGCGYWADKHWGLSPWMSVAGALAGFALGMYILIKEARVLNAQLPPPKDKK